MLADDCGPAPMPLKRLTPAQRFCLRHIEHGRILWSPSRPGKPASAPLSNTPGVDYVRAVRSLHQLGYVTLPELKDDDRRVKLTDAGKMLRESMRSAQGSQG